MSAGLHARRADNVSLQFQFADRMAHIKNGSIIILQADRYKDSDMNELLYVVIVIMFYAIALMVLIATQIKRDHREGSEVDYYDEYFQAAGKQGEQQKKQQEVLRQQQLLKEKLYTLKEHHSTVPLGSIPDEGV